MTQSHPTICTRENTFAGPFFNAVCDDGWLFFGVQEKLRCPFAAQHGSQERGTGGSCQEQLSDPSSSSVNLAWPFGKYLLWQNMQ